MGVPGITVPQCKVGPVTINRGFFLTESNEYGVDGKETFSVVGYNYEIQQLRGLITRGESKTSGSVTIRGSNDNDWGPVWIDASTPLPDNDAFPHRGWYLIREVTVELINHIKAKAVLTIELLSTHPLQYMEYDYTNPFMVGSLNTPSYALEEEVVLMEDDFTTLDPTKWVDRGTWNMTGSNVGVTGGKLYMEGRRTSGSVWAGTRMLRTKYKFKTPFTVEFDLEFNDTSTYDPGHNIHLALSPINLPLNAWQDVFFNELSISGSQRYYALGRYNAKKQNVAWGQTYTADTLRKWKWEVDSNGQITISKWNGTSYIQEWKGSMGLSSPKELYVYYVFHAHKDLTNVKRAYSDNIKIYSTQKQVVNAGVTVPAPNTGDLLTTPDETTTTTAYYSNPSSRILLQPGALDPNTIYANSPLGYSSNNPSSSHRFVTGDYERLAPGKFYVQNGDVKLSVQSDGVELYTMIGSSYSLMNKFTFGTIDYLQVLNATPESFKFQANQTEWELRRGEPFVYVKHEYDDLSYTVGTVYYHDDTLINPSGSGTVEISMLTQPYTTVFTPYNLFQSNVYRGTDTLLDTTGFTPQGSATLSSSTTHPYGGSRSLYANCPPGTSHGFLTECVNIKSGDWNACRVYLTGSGTCILQLNERNSAGSIIGGISSSPITLTTTPTRYTLLHKFSDLGVMASLKVLNNSESVGASIYADEFSICPAYNGVTYPGTVPPDSANEKALMIMKKDPTTILSGSIPASSMTGLGVYDQMQPPNNCLNFKNLALSWLNPVDGRLRLVQR